MSKIAQSIESGSHCGPQVFCEMCEDSQEIVISIALRDERFVIPCPECSIAVDYRIPFYKLGEILKPAAAE